MKKNLLSILIAVTLAAAFTWKGRAQELDCKVNVTTTKVSASDKSVFDHFSTAVNGFMNGRRWTSINFKSQERIPCSMTIEVQDYNSSTGAVKAYITVQLRRPCYKSSYTSNIFNIVDKDFSFSYVKNDRIDYSDNSIGNNLSATLAFYAYIILGNYFDSFAPRGGDAFYEKANNIVMSAQSFAEQGWRSAERNDKNRYWIAENYMNANCQAIHEVLYRYYRLGMDMMYANPAVARENIMEAMKQLQALKKQRTNLACVQLFMESKADELTNIFQPAPQEEKQKAAELFISIDAANVNTYKKILAGGR